MIKKNIAKNLVRYRTAAGFTQSELAEKINYSDKSVSKWERAEGTPDIFVLHSLSKIYGVRVDDFLIDDEQKMPEVKNFGLKKRRGLLINLLSVGLVWLVATIIYFLLNLILGLTNSQTTHSWITFIYAIPISGIVQVVFSELWWNKLASMISVSVIIWGMVVSIYLTFVVFKVGIDGGSTIFFVSAVLQVLTVFWYILRRIKQKSASVKKDLADMEDENK